MIKLSGVLVAGAAVAVLTGCAIPQPGKVSDPSSAPSASASPAAKAAMVARIGGTVTYPDGVAVTVLSAARYHMSEYTPAAQAGKVGLMVPVKIMNGTDKPLNIALTTANMHTGANGVEAAHLFDSKANVGSFSGTIAPGRAATANLGFAVLPADLGGQVSIDVKVGFQREPALFEGTVK
jgi:hypothetical protein